MMKTIDYIFMALLLAAVLIVGHCSNRKLSDSSDFLTMNKGLNKLQTGLSMAATDFGGSGLVGAVGYCYLMGMGGMWWNLAAAPGFLLIGFVLAKRLNGLNGLTVPDYLGKRYGLSVKYITSVMHICASVAALSTQFTVSSVMLNTLTGLDVRITLVIGMLITLFLTSGGLRTVVNTDILLFFVMVAAVFTAVPVTISAGGGLGEITRSLPEGFMSIGSIGIWTPLSWGILFGISYGTNQNYIQRIVSAKDGSTARFGMLFTAGFYVVVSAATGLIGVSAVSLLPEITDSNMVFSTLLVKVLPAGFAGIAVAGVFAATISTSTSVLHAVTVLSVSDVLMPIVEKREIELSDVKLSRVTTVVIALISLAISLAFDNIIAVLYTSGLFYSSAVFLLMLLGLYTDWATKKAAIASVAGSIICGLAWEFFVLGKVSILGKIPSVLVSLAVSGILLYGVSMVSKDKASISK